MIEQSMIIPGNCYCPDPNVNDQNKCINCAGINPIIKLKKKKEVKK